MGEGKSTIMSPHPLDDGSGNYDSIAEANRTVPFTLREPNHLPAGYRVIQIVVEEPTKVDNWWHAWFVCANERDDPSEQLLVSARPADDPRVPGHPCGVDEEVTVNSQPGTYARTDAEIIDPLPAGASDPTERQKGVLEFTDSAGTFYYLNGPFEKDELIHIAESIQ